MFLLLHNKVWFKWTLQKSSVFGNFAVTKGLGMINRHNDRSPKLLQNIYFYFCKKSFIQMNWKNSSIFGYFAVPKGVGITKRLIDRSPKLLQKIYFLLWHNKVWFKWTLIKSSIFGNFVILKGLGISKRLNDKSPKLLWNIHFQFYKIDFIPMNSTKVVNIWQFCRPKRLRHIKKTPLWQES